MLYNSKTITFMVIMAGIEAMAVEDQEVQNRSYPNSFRGLFQTRGWELVEEIDQIRKGIGVDRGALIKVWLHERLQQEKAAGGKQRSKQ